MEDTDDIIEQLEYNRREGNNNGRQLIVFSLSTCGFCKRALSFLDKHDFSYRFIHLDQIEPERKRRVKDVLRARFNISPIFPVLVVDDKRALTGFTELQWRKALQLPVEE